MRIHRQAIGAIVIVLLICGTFAWAEGQREASVAGEKRMTISWVGSNPRGYIMQPDNMVEERYEELFDVEIESVQIDQYNGEQMNIMFAAGDIPDFINYGGNPAALYNLGVIREIPRESIEQHYPHIVSEVEKLDNVGQAWNDVMIDGEVYAIPNVNITVQARSALVTRADWMQAVGAQVPSDTFEYARYSDGGWTLDQLEDLLYAYRHDDPDGNGRKDTYGLGHGYANSQGLGQDKFSGVMGAYGVRYGSWQEVDGKLVWSHVSDGYRQALLTLADWYQKEIIDPEFLLDKRAELAKKYSNDLLGAYFGNNRWIQSLADTPVGQLIARVPEAQPVYIYDLKGPDGQGWSGAWSRPSFGTKPKIGRDTSDEKMVKILQILQRVHTDEELYLFNFYGREGEHWHFNEEGFVVAHKEFQTGEARAELGLVGYHQGHLIDTFNIKFRLNSERYVPWYLGSLKEGLYDMLYKPIAAEHDQEFRQTRGDLGGMEQEFYYKAITGELDINAEWDGYVKQWMDAGGAKITEWANEAQYGE